MNASIELSLYPLTSEYKRQIIDFILRLREERGIEVRTNGMSTQLFGDYDTLMDLLKKELKHELQAQRCMAVLKIGEGLLKPDDLPAELK